MKFASFVLLFSLMKVLRIMMAATVWMTICAVVCQKNGYKNWRLNLGMLSLVPFACLTAYSKIFYTGKLWNLTNWMQGAVTVPMAVSYFIVAALLLCRYLSMQRRLRKTFSCMRQMEYKEAFPSEKTGRRRKITIYLSSECGSPFAGGIIRPYIVVPQAVKDSLSKEEFAAVLSHERLHIMQGHVFLLTIYVWLKILWWPHPLIYLLEKKLRENMEYSCDEGSVALALLSADEYANVILKILQMGRPEQFVKEGVTTFYDSRYAVLKKRLERLSGLCKDNRAIKEYDRRKKKAFRCGAAACLAAAAAVIATSMPRYTKLEQISVYDEKLHVLTYDMKRDGFFAEASESNFSISETEMQRIAKTYELQGEYVVFSYDTIMKVPGVGGLGQAAVVQVQDVSEVKLLGRREWVDRLELFVLKYLI